MSWQPVDITDPESGALVPESSRSQDRQDRLIPLINVVFLLLAFFIIAGTMRAADALDVEPPEAATSGSIDRESPTLVMDTQGKLALGRDQVTADQAVGRIKALLADDPDAEIHLKADARVNARDILPLLRRFSDAGISSVRLIATRKDTPQ